jgi:hypothetical protein
VRSCGFSLSRCVRSCVRASRCLDVFWTWLAADNLPMNGSWAVDPRFQLRTVHGKFSNHCIGTVMQYRADTFRSAGLEQRVETNRQ